MNLRQMLLVIMVFFGAILSGKAESGNHDGNWWRSQNDSTKFHSVADLLDRMAVGPNLSAFGMTVNVSFKPGIANPYNSTSQTYVRITGAQLVDGLDRLYSEDRNRSIAVSNAVTVVLSGAAGTPGRELTKLIEEYRKPGC